MSAKLVDVPAAAAQKGKDDLAGVKLQTLKPTDGDASPVGMSQKANQLSNDRLLITIAALKLVWVSSAQKCLCIAFLHPRDGRRHPQNSSGTVFPAKIFSGLALRSFLTHCRLCLHSKRILNKH